MITLHFKLAVYILKPHVVINITQLKLHDKTVYKWNVLNQSYRTSSTVDNS